MLHGISALTDHQLKLILILSCWINFEIPPKYKIIYRNNSTLPPKWNPLVQTRPHFTHNKDRQLLHIGVTIDKSVLHYNTEFTSKLFVIIIFELNKSSKSTIHRKNSFMHSIKIMETTYGLLQSHNVTYLWAYVLWMMCGFPHQQ